MEKHKSRCAKCKRQIETSSAKKNVLCSWCRHNREIQRSKNALIRLQGRNPDERIIRCPDCGRWFKTCCRRTDIKIRCSFCCAEREKMWQSNYYRKHIKRLRAAGRERRRLWRERRRANVQS
jgi:DNA-directed RNA polymerase subunit RPC12/RpoP